MESDSRPRVAELIRRAEGGMKEHYMALTEGLIGNGMDVIALCSLSRGDRKRLSKWGATVVPFVIRGRISPIRDILAILRLARLLRRYRVDILHCHGFRAGLIGRIAALFVRCPCIYTIHNFFPKSLGKLGTMGIAWAEKRLSGITKNIITVSGALKKYTAKGLAIDPDKIKIIYNGIDPPNYIGDDHDIRQMWGIEPEEKLVGTVARLIPAKGLDVLIDAVPPVLEEFPDTKFMIVGDGPDRSNLMDKAAHLNCSKNIIFAGHSEYIWYYYEAFDIFVLPSLSEGLGISILEAMAMGKPVIATNVGGIREIIDHNRNGYLIPPGDSGELADALLFYLENEQRTYEYAKVGRAEILTKFRLEDMIRETTQTIYEVIGRQYSRC
ncbi:MAG TPA: glycosyltransferase family 4 protein [Clostridia bacterium]|nr:glycosyltransferase family 4 protein [Clostridia bacterium]